MSTPSSLPVLRLQNPHILLPASRITLPLTADVADALLALIQQSDSLPVLAVVPTPPPSQNITNGHLINVGRTSLSNTAEESSDGYANVDIDGNDEESIGEWATAARLLRLIKPPVRNPRQPFLVSLQGLVRVRILPKPSANNSTSALLSVDPNGLLASPLPIHPISYPTPSSPPPAALVSQFKHAVMRLLDRLSRDPAATPARREDLLKLGTMLEDITEERAGWVADVVMGSVGGEFADLHAILSTPNPAARLPLATALCTKQASIAEVSTKISRAVDESLSKQQKEFFLRQQLAAIQRELHALSGNSSPISNPASSGGFHGPLGPGANNPNVSELDDDPADEADDLAELKRRIESLAPGSEERKMGVREWRRLKRIPAGSVECGVVRSYLEWLTALPWPSSQLTPSTSQTDSSKPQAQSQSQSSQSQLATISPSSTSPLTSRQFLTRARAQLDRDHYGLEKIKKRLIEYLAVVRLREMGEASASAGTSASASGTNVGGESVAEGALVRVSKGQQQPQQFQQQTVAQKRKGVKGPILLFVGPPGTGKTSLGLSIAKALERPFERISLGGVRDEAEIRGHRRTYVASGPGLIVQALRRAGRADGVVLLDEIDKVGRSNFHGDPSAALLEVLDPEQNHTFNDHYINVPIDLSQILFICTANSLDTISAPLLDRCEVIQLSGYTYDEKMHIARRFLLPKQLAANGLPPAHISITEPALLHIATRYTREAGVRSLERAIGAVARHKAVEWAECLDQAEDAGHAAEAQAGVVMLAKDGREYKRIVEEHELEKILGIARDGEDGEREERRGVVYGLVVMGQGEGGILPVETIAVPGTGALKLTGSLGDVIKESAELAMTWVKTHAYDMRITNTRAQDPLKFPHTIDIHLHLPAGAQKKDGPSAGIAMTCALVSLLTGACVPTHIAMTGEITLRGHVTPVGGIKEKVLGAHRAQISKVVLPWANRKDVEHDVAPEIRAVMEFAFVRTVHEALEAAFGKDSLRWRHDSVVMESRL